MDRLAAAASGELSGLAPGMEVAVQQLAEEWVTNALNFGCACARKRSSEQLDPADVTAFLEQAW